MKTVKRKTPPACSFAVLIAAYCNFCFTKTSSSFPSHSSLVFPIEVTCLMGKNLLPHPRQVGCHIDVLLRSAAILENGHTDADQGLTERPIATFPESLSETSSL